jgi:RsiW-degrading membrane proteinase PrsW (M82 family)
MRDPGVSTLHSAAQRILHNNILLLLGITAVALCLFVALRSNSDKSSALAAYVLFSAFFAAHICSAIRTNLLVYAFSAPVVYALFTTSAAIPFFYLFRTVLPGSPPPNPNLLDLASSAFVGSGLMEELMKSIPALFGVCLARRLITEGKPLLRRSIPTHGMLIGFAAGAGFVYVDTLYHVLPDSGVYVANTDNSAFSSSGLEGYVHLLERILSGIFSHVLWTSISGFFIGLASRDLRFWPILLTIAWVLPASFHTLWNLSPFLGAWARWIKVLLPMVTFIACFIRARQILSSSDSDVGSAEVYIR